MTNNEETGIIYDWKLIEKEYKKLGIPEGFFEIPFNAIRNGCKYLFELSERSTGKTTQYLLLGLIMHKLYSTLTIYIRATEDELKPSHAEKLVEVIRTYKGGHYILKATNGKYNSMYYHWKQFFYCLRDDNGEILEKSEVPVIQCLSVDRHLDYKSTFNAPNGDLILFDEFIGKFYRPDEALHFMDLVKTIIRDRYKNPLCVMLANTINKNSMYFEEFEISREIKNMKKGESKIIVTDRGTRIFFELIDIQKKGDSPKHRVNSLFFGFKNPKLNSITGGELFAFAQVPHIIHNPTNKRTIKNNIYIDTNTDLLQIEFVYTDEQGYHIEIHRASTVYDDSYILSLSPIVGDMRYHFGFGEGNISRVINDFLINRKAFYSSNEVGAEFSEYLHRYTAERNRI